MIDTLNPGVSGSKASARFAGVISNSTFQYLALASITLLALALRLVKLGSWSLWIDEALEINYAQEALRNFFAAPRLSLLAIGAVFRLFPITEWSARLAPTLVGAITIPVLYFPIKKLFGAGVALLAVFLLTISPTHLFWSQNARFYTFLLIFYALAQFAFFFWLETDRFWLLIVTGLFFGLAALERMVAGFLAPVVVLYFVALLALPFGKPAGFRWRNIIILVGVGVAGLLFVIFKMGVLTDFSIYILGHEQNPFRVFLSVVYDVGVPLFLFALIGGAYLIFQKSRIGLYLLIGAVAPVVLLVLIAPFTQAFSRYVFITLPNWVILGAVAAKEIFAQAQKNARILAVGVLLILVVDAFSQDMLYYGFQNGNRQDFKGAFGLVQQEKMPDDLVISTSPQVGDFYLGQGVADSQKLDLNSLTQSGRRAWFVIDNRVFVSPELQKFLDQKTQLMGVYDVYMPGKNMTMRDYLYSPSAH
ncbi:MAG TPA: glycosyltransferase family 39 protein [Anaerolineales bacterium]